MHGIHTYLDGRSSTSREPMDALPTRVTVVDGDAIVTTLPWLDSLYRNELARLASDFAGKSVSLAQDSQSAVNINSLEGQGARYERHVDSNPVTGILFATTLTSDEGGELVFESSPDELVIRPEAGMFIVFDARDIVHYVMPLKKHIERLSIPMNFYLPDANQRPVDLDRYLYKTPVA
jgi:hypothetical protein